MQRIIYTLLFGAIVSAPAFAQDAPPTGIGYIPGMPVPEKMSAPAESAPAPGNARQGGTNGGRQDGKISKVSVSGSQKGGAKAAQPREAPMPESAPAPIVPAEYKGVTPPKRMKPQNEETFAKTPANQLSWIGFMPEEKSHRIFLQTTSPTAYERIATPRNRVELRLTDTKLAVSNNKRELDMKYFKSPFARAYAKSEGKNVRVVVELKEPAETQIAAQDNLISIIAAAPPETAPTP